jgi:anti-sigma factor RsiW
MNCSKFQDSITDYLDGALDSRARAECATHRLRCRECRELFNDVRAAVGALSSYAREEVNEPAELEAHILAATTAGEMLSCSAFDSLIERYFDGVILAPTFQTFQAHFEHCSKCRRLLAGIEEAIEMCREVKEAEVEMPHSLYDRIVAATVGPQQSEEAPQARWLRRGRMAYSRFVRPLWSPQWAAAALIFAASCLMINSRFGSVSGMASEASAQAERWVTEGHAAINQTGTMAITGIQRVSSQVSNILQDAKTAKPKAHHTEPDPLPSPAESAAPPDQAETEKHLKPDPRGTRQPSRRPAGKHQNH